MGSERNRGTTFLSSSSPSNTRGEVDNSSSNLPDTSTPSSESSLFLDCPDLVGYGEFLVSLREMKCNLMLSFDTDQWNK